MCVRLQSGSNALVFEVNDAVPVHDHFTARTLGSDAHTLAGQCIENALFWLDSDPQRQRYQLMNRLLMRTVPWPAWLEVQDVYDGEIEWIMLQRIMFRRRQALLACGVPEARGGSVLETIPSYAQPRVARQLGQFIDECSVDKITLFAVPDCVLSVDAITSRLLGVYFALLPSLRVPNDMRGGPPGSKFNYTQMTHFLKTIGIAHRELYSIARRIVDDSMLQSIIHPLLVHSLYTNRLLFPAHFAYKEVFAVNAAVRCVYPTATVPLNNGGGGGGGGGGCDELNVDLIAQPPPALFPRTTDMGALERLMNRRIATALSALHVTDRDVCAAYRPVLVVDFQPVLSGVACSDGIVYQLSNWPLFCLGPALEEFTYRLSQVLLSRFSSFYRAVDANLVTKDTILSDIHAQPLRRMQAAIAQDEAMLQQQQPNVFFDRR